ncbi:MAG TPA: hypothetical protein VFZ53_17810 [Polyangiaceae bacterium]
MRPAAALGALALLVAPGPIACGGRNGPPRHPAGELGARAAAKLDVVELVVSDPARAERLRRIYREAWQLGRDFDLARASSLRQAYAVATTRTTPHGQSERLPASALERTLVPPLELGRATFARYTALMLEARTLLTEDEFRKLDATR